MTADERIALIGVKIERAKKHIKDLETEIRAYLDARPYVIDSYVQAHPRPHRIYYLTKIKPIPDSIKAITGDILFNARATLDHLVYHLADTRGFVDDEGTALKRREIAELTYPILDSETAKEYIADGTFKRKVKGIPKVARNAIVRTKPYKGGNKALWRLHRLHNIDKHRLVVTAASALHSIDDRALFENVRRGYRIDPTLVLDPRHLIGPAKEGKAVHIDQISPKTNNKIQIRFQVVLHEAGVIECEPILETLDYMVDFVELTVRTFRKYLV